MGVSSLQDGREGAGELLAPAVSERGRRPGGLKDRDASFSSHSPKCHRQDLPWDRRDPQDQQHLGLQKDPEEEVRVDGYSSASGIEGCSALAKPLHGLGALPVAAATLKEPHPAPQQDMGGPECWGSQNNTYGWSGKTLQPGEAAVALQPSLSSLSRLTLVTARPLGTLEGEKGTCQA